MSAEARLKQLGLVLPNVASPVANYVPFRLAGNLLFLSGVGYHKPGTIQVATKAVLDEIEENLKSAGSSMDKVLKASAACASANESSSARAFSAVSRAMDIDSSYVRAPI